MLTQLTKADRLQLMKFVCSFAWVDLEVRKEERAFAGELLQRLALEEDEKTLVEGWLEVPPKPEEVDPAQVPQEHKALFLSVIRNVIESDGDIAADEAEVYAVFADLLAG